MVFISRAGTELKKGKQAETLTECFLLVDRVAQKYNTEKTSNILIPEHKSAAAALVEKF